MRRRLALIIALLLSALLFSGCDANLAEQPATQLSETGIPAESVKGIPAIPYVEDESDQSAANLEVQQDLLTVRFLDVGQGDAALVTCAGQSLLIDGGPSSASSKLYAILTEFGIDHLDYIIASHPDADHCGGISGALNAASCGTFYCSVAEHDTKTFQSIVKYLGTTPVTVPKAGDSFALGPATVQFVGPIKPTRDTNNGSLVCKLIYGDVSFLFTGDAETESESEMLASGTALQADVLKVGHHGSASSSSQRFLAAVNPAYAVISVGDNGYGHPTEEVLARLGSTGAQVMRTDELGTITFQTNGSSIEVEATKGRVAS